MHMLFMGPLFPREREKELISLSKAGISNAANTFQWNMINGLNENPAVKTSIMNVLPVGCWPRHFSRFVLPDIQWMHGEQTCYEIGGINVPFLKQYSRYKKVKKLLMKNCAEEVIVCTTYLPFLWALKRSKKCIGITMVVTDLPEFADMHQVSFFRKVLRRLHTAMVYQMLDTVDRFVLLTDQMKEPLKVGNRPYIVMEGICEPKHEKIGSEKKRALLYTGRLNRQYGLQILLQAFSQIEDPSVELWICGSGEMEHEIRHQASLDGRIRFFGYMPHTDVLRLQREATILVNPRTNQGAYTKYSFPSKTMEYMLSGTPVVMYKLDGIPDDYDPYLIYIQDPNAASMKKTLESALNMDEANRNRFASRAQDFVCRNKNSAVQMERVLKLIRENPLNECRCRER